MPDTPRFTLPYPLLTDVADVPADMQALAEAVDYNLVEPEVERRVITEGIVAENGLVPTKVSDSEVSVSTGGAFIRVDGRLRYFETGSPTSVPVTPTEQTYATLYAEPSGASGLSIGVLMGTTSFPYPDPPAGSLILGYMWWAKTSLDMSLFDLREPYTVGGHPGWGTPHFDRNGTSKWYVTTVVGSHSSPEQYTSSSYGEAAGGPSVTVPIVRTGDMLEVAAYWDAYVGSGSSDVLNVQVGVEVNGRSQGRYTWGSTTDTAASSIYGDYLWAGWKELAREALMLRIPALGVVTNTVRAFLLFKCVDNVGGGAGTAFLMDRRVAARLHRTDL